MTRDKIKQRRESIASFLRTGKTIRQAMAKFAVSRSIVDSICLEYSIEPRKDVRQSPVKAMQIVADLLRGERLCDVARKRNVDKQRVCHVKQEAIAEGIVFPRASK